MLGAKSGSETYGKGVGIVRRAAKGWGTLGGMEKREEREASRRIGGSEKSRRKCRVR